MARAQAKSPSNIRPAAPAAPECLVCHSVKTQLWARATDAEYRTTAAVFGYYACKDCGVLFIDPVPRDQLATIYPANYYSFATPKKTLITQVKKWLDARVFTRLLKAIGGDSLSVLDVGGGAGWQLDALRALDPRVHFTQIVDLDVEAEREARNNGHEYFHGRIEEFASARKFDLVLMLNLIEHVDDPAAVLSKMGEILKPNGVVLIKTPNYDAMDARLFRHGNWAGLHCPRHWVLFTKESLFKLTERVGFEVIDFSYTQGAPFWAASTLFWLSRKGMADITRKRPVVYHPAFGVLSATFAAFDMIRKPFAKTSQMFLLIGKRHA